MTMQCLCIPFIYKVMLSYTLYFCVILPKLKGRFYTLTSILQVLLFFASRDQLLKKQKTKNKLDDESQSV